MRIDLDRQRLFKEGVQTKESLTRKETLGHFNIFKVPLFPPRENTYDKNK